MISFISGKVTKYALNKESFVDVLTDIGIGYRVLLPTNYNIIVNEKIELFTHFHVREDAQTLYGFKTTDERDFFEILISVSGIGPKIGLAIISTYSKKELEEIISQGDAKKLSKVSGLGLKGAQKIILELRGKIDFEAKEGSQDGKVKEIREILKTLGFVGEQLKSGVEYAEVVLSKNSDIEIEELVKKVLSHD